MPPKKLSKKEKKEKKNNPGLGWPKHNKWYPYQ